MISVKAVVKFGRAVRRGSHIDVNLPRYCPVMNVLLILDEETFDFRSTRFSRYGFRNFFCWSFLKLGKIVATNEQHKTTFSLYTYWNNHTYIDIACCEFQPNVLAAFLYVCVRVCICRLTIKKNIYIFIYLY